MDGFGTLCGRFLSLVLSKPKELIPVTDRSGVVYRIKCSDCQATCVGETGRPLQKRIKEHKAIRTANTTASAIAERV